MRQRVAIFLIVFSALLIIPLQSQKKKSPKDLPPQHRKWLEEEVAYIISRKERDVFLQLESDREREIFIQAFWKQRDPSPNTEENEFKKEHYRRIDYANQWLGKTSPSPGWKTDMGRIYIILGEPKSIESYENLSSVYPTVIWFFDGMTEYGLPGSFYVVFFKKGGMGDYELYSPIQDGPQSLLVRYYGDMENYESAYYALFEAEPALAEVSLSLIPGEPRMTLSPSLASQILIGTQIPAAPYEKVKLDYADKLLKYKDVIEVDYSANYIGSESLVNVFQDGTGLAFVHYLVEPARLSFEEFQGRYHTELEISGHVTDLQGNTIYQFERTLPIDLNEEQIARIRNRLFSVQDLFPLLPGQYKLNVLLKNRVSKEFTSFEADLVVPAPASFSMSAPLLGNRIDRESKYRGLNKAFLLGDIQIVPSPRNDFQPGDTLYVYLQFHHLPAEVSAGGTIEYQIVKEDQILDRFSRSLSAFPDRTNILEEISLAKYPPAHYQIKISVRDAGLQERISAQALFYISPVASLPRPWVLSLPQPASDDPSFANLLGNQHLSQRNIAQARPLLEKAYRMEPASEKYALDYCRVLFLVRDFAGVRQVGAPFWRDQKNHQFLQILGQSSQAMGEIAEAIDYYKEYLAYFGTNVVVLNAIGECYYQLGDIAQAVATWERSLQIEPKQEKLIERMREVKEKK